MSDWEKSADAWIKSLGDQGDRGRRYVLDPAMMPLLRAGGYKKALDVGCGEGRLCRLMADIGIEATGIDPTPSLIAHARTAQPHAHFLEGVAEDLPFEDESFDLVVSCMALIDIPDYQAGIAEMVRVLQRGGTLLIANLTSFKTSGTGPGLDWQRNLLGQKTHFAANHYLEERVTWEEWQGIRVQNHHRPLSAYMRAFLGHGLVLTHFDEPRAVGASPEFTAHYDAMPWFVVMAWTKP
jgi:ubiquinone/menaquinone biosynthesis C-methylase UbiE